MMDLPHALTTSGALMLGIVSGSMHCTAMCGGIVLGFQETRQSRGVKYFTDQIGFHGGRMTTYLAVALLLATLGAWIHTSGPHFVRALWKFTLGIILLATGLSIGWPHLIRSRATRRVGFRVANVFRRFWRRRWGAVFISGLAWGFIPCGFSGAVIAAAATRTPIEASTIIIAFGMGTSIPLSAIPFFSQTLRQKAPQFARTAVGYILVAWGSTVAIHAIHVISKLMI